MPGSKIFRGIFEHIDTEKSAEEFITAELIFAQFNRGLATKTLFIF